MHLLYPKHLKKLLPLFDSLEDTLILSCLQNHMGRAWADHLEQPTFAVLQVSDFVFLAGDVSSPYVIPFLKELLTVTERDLLLIITKDETFGNLLQNLYGDKFKAIKRYKLQMPPQFDTVLLQDVINHIPSGYTLCPLEGKWYDQALKEDWSRDLVSSFGSLEDYMARGLGMVLIKDGEIVSGASSYSIYTGGLEIEIDTKEPYRKQGLARIVGAALILAALRKGLDPHWDAANETSVRLAQRLGYLYQGSYTTYLIRK